MIFHIFLQKYIFFGKGKKKKEKPRKKNSYGANIIEVSALVIV